MAWLDGGGGGFGRPWPSVGHLRWLLAATAIVFLVALVGNNYWEYVQNLCATPPSLPLLPSSTPPASSPCCRSNWGPWMCICLLDGLHLNGVCTRKLVEP
eukprot:SM004392S15728  [mRNA]  locus=s4392:908:1207:- [translate_table: standard]